MFFQHFNIAYRQFVDLPAVTPQWWVRFGQPITFNNDMTWQDDLCTAYEIEPKVSLDRRFCVIGESPSLVESQHEKSDRLSKLLNRYGDIPQAIAQLQGTFALVVWDRENRELWLARDPVGERTLYYTFIGSTLWVAPRLKTLAPFHPRELDLVALRDYLCCAFVPGEQTLWRNVREVRPGTIHRWSEGKNSPEIQVYWQLEEKTGDRDRSLEWYAQQLRSLLDRVVQESLPKGEPVGAYLSGGLDSSSITALACQFHDRPVHTYSIHFGADYPNELEFANLVAEYCGTQHHILEIKPREVWKNLPVTLAHLDDPIGDPLTVPNYLLGQAAKQEVGVILNGEGGDPCFGGPKNKPMLLYELYDNLNAHSRDRLTAYLDSFKKCFPHLSQLLKPEIWQAVKDTPYVFATDLDSQNQYLNRLMLLNIKFKGADHILTKVNNLTRAAGIEGRSPLFDRRIVELSLQIPPEYKLSEANEKAVLKAAVTDILPDSIIYRPKSGMRVPVRWWFSRYWQRRTKALLLNKNAAIAPYVNQQLIREFFNPQSPCYRRFGIKLWLLVSLEIWLQTYRSL
ncbi:MAG: asparagine synthase [Cyanobacteria bacterium SBLK]|nr:asparagine synthase [Cyanobacteria bacterium SBLK]